MVNCIYTAHTLLTANKNSSHFLISTDTLQMITTTNNTRLQLQRKFYLIYSRKKFIVIVFKTVKLKKWHCSKLDHSSQTRHIPLSVAFKTNK